MRCLSPQQLRKPELIRHRFADYIRVKIRYIQAELRGTDDMFLGRIWTSYRVGRASAYFRWRRIYIRDLVSAAGRLPSPRQFLPRSIPCESP